MNALKRSSKSRFVHKLLAATVLVAGLGGIALSSTPAEAHDGWYGERARHEWREHEWREHHGWYRPYYGYSYYAPAPRYYYPPAVVYAPPPPPQASFNVVIPFR